MPFDNTPQNGLTMADLAWRLRNPDTWPDGFVWDYSHCNVCAMGLAWELSGGRRSAFDYLVPATVAKLAVGVLRDADAMDAPELRAIFLLLHHRMRKPRRSITPEDVADAIDQHIARKRAAVLEPV